MPKTRSQYPPTTVPSRRGRHTPGWLALVFLLATGPAAAGGGVMLQNDTCIITIGFYTAHFTAYQPGTRGDEEFCEDLPDTGETVFVLDYLHESLREVPLEMRIIRNVTGLGRFVGLAEISALDDLESATVFHRPPTVEADASYQVSHVFDEPGDYVGIVIAGHPSKDKTFTAVFPFAVGVGGAPYLWVVVAVVVALVVVVLAFVWLRPGHPRGAAV